MTVCPHRQGGFTLLALLFLVASLGIGMAALGTLWHTAVQRDKEKELLFVGDQYRRAIERFWNIPLPQGQKRRLPKSLDELLLDPRFPQTVRHLRRLYRDPMTGELEWGLVKDAAEGIVGVYSLSDKPPFKSSGFPAAYSGFADKTRYMEWVFVSRFQGSAASGTTSANPSLEETSSDQASTGHEPAETDDQPQRLSCNAQRIALEAECVDKAGGQPQSFLACKREAASAYRNCILGGGS